MPKIEQTTTNNRLLDSYLELNEQKKADLRKAFLEKFELSPDTFYKKINQISPLWNLEKEFFAQEFKVSLEELFPVKEKGAKNAN